MGAEEITFSDVQLGKGPQTLEARLVRGNETVGVAYVDVVRKTQ